MACGFYVTWTENGQPKTGLFEALVVEHTPGNQPALCRLITVAKPSPNTTQAPISHTLIELRQIDTITVEGLLHLTIPRPAALTTSEDRVRDVLNALDLAERLLAYKYLYALGIRIADCSEADVRRAREKR